MGRKWQATPVFFPGKSYGQRSLVSYSLWGRRDSDTTETKQQVKEASLKRLHTVSQFRTFWKRQNYKDK